MLMERVVYKLNALKGDGSIQMVEIVKQLIDPGYELQKALFRRDFTTFENILKVASCSMHDLNCCLAFAAAVKGCGHFSRALMDAGADRQCYLDGRLDRSAIRGDAEKIDVWHERGANPYHNSHQPLRAALFEKQERAVYHLVASLGCSFEAATKPQLMGGLQDLEDWEEISRLMTRVRSKVGQILTLGAGDVRRLSS